MFEYSRHTLAGLSVSVRKKAEKKFSRRNKTSPDFPLMPADLRVGREENGIYLFGLLLIHSTPLLVEAGILLDVTVGVFIIGIIVDRIQREHQTSTRRLRGHAGKLRQVVQERTDVAPV